MARIPEEASDDTIERLMLNAETILGDRPVSVVIDLRRRYTFVTRMVGTFRQPQYECIDALTYDPDPDARFHCVGYGATEGAAKGDLLEKIAWAVAHE